MAAYFSALPIYAISIPSYLLIMPVTVVPRILSPGFVCLLIAISRKRTGISWSFEGPVLDE